MRWIATALALTFICAYSVSAIEPGASLPSLDSVKWIQPSSSSSKDAEKKSGRLSVLMLFDASEQGSADFIALLEALSEKYAPTDTPVSAMAVSKPVKGYPIKEFSSSYGPFAVPIGCDEDMKTFKELSETETILPYAIVSDGGGGVIWTGHPSDIESVVGRMADGSFSLSSQKRISGLRKELQMAVQAGLPEVVSTVAGKILEISPRDSIAIQAALFALETQDRVKDAASFMERTCLANPKDDFLRIQLLALHIRHGDAASFKAGAAKFAEDFEDSPAALGRLAAFLMDASPFGELQVELALDSAESAAAALPESASPNEKASAFETLARAFYYAGAFEKSLECQSKACKLTAGSRFESQAKKLLNYYKSALKMQKGLEKAH